MRGLRRGAAVIVAAWAAWVAASLFFALRDVQHGTAIVSSARHRLSPDDLVSGRTLGPVHAARHRFARAHFLVGEPLLAPLRFLPVAGRQLQSVRALSGAAERVLDVGGRAMGQARAALAGPHPAGPERLALLSRLGGIAGDARARLAPVGLGPGHALVGPLARKRAKFALDLARARDGLTRAQAATAGIADLLSGQHHYLLLAGNNAEMRAGSAMFLSAAVLTGDDGHLSMGPVRPTADLAVPGEGVPITGDLADRWGWAHPNREWRNLGVDPRFDVTGELAARMWQADTGQQVDGVLSLDVEAVREVLAATGPVTVQGSTVTPDQVVGLLMHDQYAGLPAGADQAGQQARRDRLGALASAALQASQGPDASLSKLGAGLARAATGRHVLAWARPPEVEAAWDTAGISGRMGPDDLLVAVLNRGGNKLDYFLNVGDGVAARRGANGSVDVTLRIDVANTTPEGEAGYVAGADPAIGRPEGAYAGFLAVNLPAGARNAAIDGSPRLVAAGPDGQGSVLAAELDLSRGEHAQLVVRFELPGGARRFVRVIPSARLPGVTWKVSSPGSRAVGSGGGFDDSQPHALAF